MRPDFMNIDNNHLRLFLFIYMYGVCGSVCSVCVPNGGQMSASDPMELELQVLRAELRSSGKRGKHSELQGPLSSHSGY